MTELHVILLNQGSLFDHSPYRFYKGEVYLRTMWSEDRWERVSDDEGVIDLWLNEGEVELPDE